MSEKQGDEWVDEVWLYATERSGFDPRVESQPRGLPGSLDAVSPNLTAQIGMQYLTGTDSSLAPVHGSPDAIHFYDCFRVSGDLPSDAFPGRYTTTDAWEWGPDAARGPSYGEEFPDF